MSSEQLADGVNPLDAELAATWDVLKGYSGRDTDLGIARRFGGAAAAYSLRDVGAMNGRVVKARRDVDGDGTDKEEDFSANQVSSGALEDWVNGKLESTLPADVATAAAAYSLRKVKASYSGNAVRIRRSSDNVEVDVAFDSDSKVSSSSSISTVSGSTTATDLNGFLNANEQTVGVAQNGTGSLAYNSFTGDSNTGFTVTNSDAGTFKQAVFGYESGEGDVIVANFDLNITSGTPTIQVRTGASIGTLTAKSNDATVSSSTNHTVTLTCTGDGLYIKFLESDACTFSVSNFTIVSHTQGATVHTWYDQAGSADAVQATAANQPKIAENGALLSNGIDFDGTDDYLDFSEDICDNINSFSGFVQAKSDGDTSSQIIFSTGFSGNNNIIGLGRGSTHSRMSYSNNTYDIATVDALENGCLLSIIAGSSTVKGFNNAVEGTSQSSVSDNPPESGGLGAHNGTGSFFDGKIKEAIFYKSDQSDNRFKIESNINNYYGLYTFQGNGFVETWYDQSGNLRDAIQGTATNQPSIVQNGGIVKVNSKPAITFDGNDNFLEVDGSGSAVAYSFSPSGDFGMFIVSKQSSGNVIDSRDAGGDGIFLQQSSGTDTRFRYNGDGSINIVATNDAQHFNTMTLDGTTLSASVDGGTAGTDTVTAGVSTTQNLVLGAGFNQANATDGEIQEAIFYENNKTTDKANIEADIDNFYSIT